MEAASWLDELQALHAKKLSFTLDEDDVPTYLAAVDRFLAQVVAEQNAGVPSGRKLRSTPRVLRSVPVVVSWAGGSATSVSLDLGSGGFSAFLANVPPPDLPLTAAVRFRGRQALECPVRVAGARQRRGSVRVSFAFGDLAATERDRLSTYILDELLRQHRVPTACATVGSTEVRRPAGDLRHVA